MSKETDKRLDSILSAILKNSDFNLQDLPKGKEFLASLASWAGKGKDELVQLICREIGVATAAILKEPLTQLLENRKLQFTVELVPTETPNKKPKSGASKS